MPRKNNILKPEKSKAHFILLKCAFSYLKIRRAMFVNLACHIYQFDVPSLPTRQAAFFDAATWRMRWSVFRE